ncbi:MAG: hypothetical protein ACRC5W_01970 [Cetobacterium sp.]|uniref:hypothetical protein n=1 Tax=Cetobacterium sp. TaxID=2071632 RepID=UPI003F40DF7A
MPINHNKNIIKSFLAIVLGVALAKYTTYSFSFEIPIIALSVVSTTSKFNLKEFVKSNSWLPLSAALGVLAGELFKEKYFLFAIFSFGIFFTCFYFVKKNPKAILNSILGYSFTSVYSTYANQNMEKLVYDIVIVSILGGILGFIILTFFRNDEKIIKKEILSNHKNIKEDVHIKKIILLTTIIFLTWLLYIIFNIKETFFAFATLAVMYGNLDFKKIHQLTPLVISIHLTGCSIAIIYSFFINGFSSSMILFLLSLSIIFFPILYFKYYGNSEIIKSFFNSLISATILPICLYLTPTGDITSKASARALQISIFLAISFVMTKILIMLGDKKNER